VILALGSFALFAGFIGHITNMLQPSSIIASILAEASTEDRHYPAEIGEEPRQPRGAMDAVVARREEVSTDEIEHQSAVILETASAKLGPADLERVRLAARSA
jgi:hypothetical protein